MDRHSLWSSSELKNLEEVREKDRKRPLPKVLALHRAETLMVLFGLPVLFAIIPVSIEHH